MDELSNEEEIKILKYLDNEMTTEERLAFEAELSKNEALRQGLALEKNMHKVGQSAGEKINQYFSREYIDREAQAIIKKARENWEKGSPSSSHDNLNKVKPLLSKKVFAIAATVIGIALISALYLFNKKESTQIAIKKNQGRSESITHYDSPSIEKTIPRDSLGDENIISPAKQDALFAENFLADIAPPDAPEEMQLSLAYYNAKEYQNALKQLNKIDINVITRRGVEDKKDESDKKFVLLYTPYLKSLSLLAMGKADRAIPELQTAIAQKPAKSLSVKAQWYLALAYLKAHNVNSAKALLKQIANDSHAGNYKSKAFKLQKKLTEYSS